MPGAYWCRLRVQIHDITIGGRFGLVTSSLLSLNSARPVLRICQLALARTYSCKRFLVVIKLVIECELVVDFMTLEMLQKRDSGNEMGMGLGGGLSAQFGFA